MISLSVNNLKKSYGVDLIFDNISFTINEKEKVALVGKNGAGKSTLFKIIIQEEEKDSGEIFISKDKKIGYMSQNVNIKSDKTLLEETLEVFKDIINLEQEIRNLEQEISKFHENKEKSEILMDEYSKKLEKFTLKEGYSYNSKAKGVLKGLGFTDKDLDKKVNLLSGGEKSRLLLSKILLQNPDILLLDEPTNHLDVESIDWLEAFLKNYNGTILIISHDRYFLNSLTTKTIDIENKTAKVYNFNYEKYVIEKEKDKELELKNFEKNQSEIKRQKEIIAKLKSFGSEKKIKRAKSREKMLSKMEVVEKPKNDSFKSNIFFRCSVNSGKDVMHIRNLSKSFGDKILFKDVNIDIYRGEKIALIGKNGCGKTTFFNMILGNLPIENGKIELGQNVNISYFNQERSDLNMNNTVLEEIWSNYKDLNEVDVRKYLAGFAFIGEDVFKTVESLSGGEKSRLSMLKLMLSKSNFLFMDEPTNHLDIESKEVLEDAIVSYEGTVFVISHDRYFLNKIADRIFEIKDGKFDEYLGNYDDMISKKNELMEYNEFLNKNKKKPTKTEIKKQQKKDKALEFEKRQLKNKEKLILKNIEAIEKNLKSIDLKMCDEKIYSNEEEMIKITKEREELENNLSNLYEEWEEINLKIEEEN